MTGNLPTGLWVEARLRDLSTKAMSCYIIQKGNHSSGLVMIKVSNLEGSCLLMTQQRNFMTDELEWVAALEGEQVAEKDADDYIRRACERDPDLWVIEIEDREMNNPFLD